MAAVLFCITALLPGVARADNPIVQHIYTADPAPLVYNGRVYLYTGHDEDNSTYFTMKDWRGWWSAPKGNWNRPPPPPRPAPVRWAGSHPPARPNRPPHRQRYPLRPGAGPGRPCSATASSTGTCR